MNRLHGLVFYLAGFAPLSSAFWGQMLTRRKMPVHSRVAAIANGDADASINTPRNMFSEYNQPIILLGVSSDSGNEIQRLGNYLVDAHFRDGSVVSAVDPSGNVLSADEIVSNHKWPEIVTLDFKDTLAESEANLEEHLTTLATSLYQSGLLAVFVNVNPEKSGMSEKSAALSSRLEEAVFVPSSDYELCIQDEGSSASDDGWEHIEWELTRLIARARLIPAVPGDTTRTTNSAHLTMGEHTFFLSLSFPNIAEVEPYVGSMCLDVDAMEYRTDLLECRESRFDLLYGMQLLRRYCRPHACRCPAIPFVGSVIEDAMPIVYTVRTANQAGTYPDDTEGIKQMFKTLEWGLRAGVEVLDVESAWNPILTNELLSKAEERYSSQILGSHHVVGAEVSTEEAVLLFEQCALSGRAHGAKVVLSIKEDSSDRLAYEAALIASELALQDGDPVIPHISLILGDVGQFSRVINLPFTPVTHESLPFKAAPGQMTSNEIMTTRMLTKVFQSKKYAILGHNIAYSVSPQMHGAAFAATKLPHKYVRVDVPTVEEFIESPLFQGDDFGGTSVTIPHKQAIIPYVDVLSEAAKEIGSVNTVIAREEYCDDDFKRVIYGDNTDWKGIFNPLDRLLGSTVNPSTDYALILGAGGTARAAAYVAKKLGLKRIYFNRTPSKAQDLVDTFGGSMVTSLEKDDAEKVALGQALDADSRLRVVISTLPAASEFTLPEWVLPGGASNPIIFDVNYKPFYTALLKQAEKENCSVVRGSEMLWEQGVGQFELWTGRTAPYQVMKEVVLANCQETPKKE